MNTQPLNRPLDLPAPQFNEMISDDDGGNHVMGLLVLSMLTGMMLAAAMLLMGYGLIASFLGYVLSTQCSIVLFAVIQARVRGSDA